LTYTLSNDLFVYFPVTPSNLYLDMLKVIDRSLGAFGYERQTKWYQYEARQETCNFVGATSFVPGS